MAPWALAPIGGTFEDQEGWGRGHGFPEVWPQKAPHTPKIQGQGKPVNTVAMTYDRATHTPQKGNLKV